MLGLLLVAALNLLRLLLKRRPLQRPPRRMTLRLWRLRLP